MKPGNNELNTGIPWLCRNIDDERFICDHNVYEYGEDTWTRRLYVAIKLRYTNMDVSYTADARGMACNTVILRRLPLGTKIEVLLFHGSPDMLIQGMPISWKQDALKPRCIRRCVFNDTRRCQSTNWIYSSDDDSNILNELKDGHLYASIIGKGLFVVRSSGKCILFQVKISKDGMSISACTYCFSPVPQVALCKALKTPD